jgi:outer membrane protein assembly factor BamB
MDKRRAHPRFRQGPGYPLQSFLPPLAVKKYFRCYPVRRLLVVFFFLFAFTFQIHGQVSGSAGAEGRNSPQDKILPIWRQALGGTVTGFPAVQAESAVVVLDSGSIKAFSTGGKPLWTYSAPGKLSPFVTRSREGASYIGQTNGILIAVNRAGRELWRVNAGSPLSGAVIPGWDGRIFVPAGKTISCYTGAGRRLWQRSPESPIDIQPVPDKRGGILMVLENGDLVRIDPFGRMSSFSLSEVPLVVLPVGTSQAPAHIGDERLLIIYKNGALETSGPDGEDRWKLPDLPSPPLAAVCRLNQGAAVLNNGRLLSFSVDTGEVLWIGETHIAAEAHTAGSPVAETGAGTVAAGTRAAAGRGAIEAASRMIFDERGIYVLSPTGAVGFTADGRRLWIMQVKGAAAVPAFGDDGVLYSGGSDWILYAYKLEDRILQQKQSLYGPIPEGNYGLGSPPPASWADYHYRFNETELNTQLELITRALNTGQVGENELAYTGYLMEILKKDLPHPGVSLLHPQVQLRRRIQALRLLSSLGSPEIIPFLTEIFSRDNEDLVKAAAAEALGSIGIDPDGLALRAFTNAILAPGTIRNEQSLLAIAIATGALCRFSGPPLSNTGVKILTSLAANGRPQAVQQRARREIELMGK